MLDSLQFEYGVAKLEVLVGNNTTKVNTKNSLLVLSSIETIQPMF